MQGAAFGERVRDRAAKREWCPAFWPEHRSIQLLYIAIVQANASPTYQVRFTRGPWVRRKLPSPELRSHSSAETTSPACMGRVVALSPCQTWGGGLKDPPFHGNRHKGRLLPCTNILWRLLIAFEYLSGDDRHRQADPSNWLSLFAFSAVATVYLAPGRPANSLGHLLSFCKVPVVPEALQHK